MHVPTQVPAWQEADVALGILEQSVPSPSEAQPPHEYKSVLMSRLRKYQHRHNARSHITTHHSVSEVRRPFTEMGHVARPDGQKLLSQSRPRFHHLPFQPPFHPPLFQPSLSSFFLPPWTQLDGFGGGGVGVGFGGGGFFLQHLREPSQDQSLPQVGVGGFGAVG